MEEQESVSALVAEYRSLLGNVDTDKSESLEAMLVCQGDWTSEAAQHLVQLSRKYGSFMLRNALAISLALETEDGNLGF